MNEITAYFVIVLLTILTAKKTPIFGQMTLTGSRALDWLKPNTKMEIELIEMGDANAFSEDYNLPEWASGWIAIIHPVETYLNPTLITQKTALQWIENQCIIWTDDKNNVAKGIKRNKLPVAQMFFKKEKPIVEFKRKDKTKFAPYEGKIHTKE